MLTSLVARGDGAAKLLGYPTANLKLRPSEVPFTSGVYAAYATLKHERFEAALVIQDDPWKVEVFFVNYTGPDFYGTRIEVDPIQKLSPIEHYDSPEELKEKIKHDLQLIKEFFTERKEKQGK